MPQIVVGLENKSLESMTQFDKVIVFSGRTIDSRDRSSPRFPSSKEEIVAQRLKNQLKAWDIGKNSLAICSGACGGDILFAEACLDLGAKVDLYIPLSDTEFIDRSIRIKNTDNNWEDRYWKLSNYPQVSKYFLQDYQGELPKDISVFALNNLWIINSATTIASKENLYGLLVWDEKSTGDGAGGTSDFAHTIQERGEHIAIINPTKL